MKIVHVITGLNDGGAEHTLFKICKHDKFNEHIVVSLTGSGKYTPLLKKLEIEVYNLEANFFSAHKFFFLIKLLRLLNPNIVQTWLVHADLIGGIAARLAGIKNVIWNIRYSNLERGKAKITTVLIVKILSKLSFFIPKLIIIVSKKAKKIYETKGYDKKKLIFIPNGYDLSSLSIHESKKITFYKKNNINKGVPLIGNVARYDPKKDHPNLINALSIIRSKNIEFFCILFGNNIDQDNIELISQIKKLKLSNYVKLFGQNKNIPEVMNGLDIYIQSSSYGEGFPNVVAEAMACGTPCVVTDVGDAALIVDKNGWIVPPNNSQKLANAIEKAISEMKSINWNKRCEEARVRIEKNYDIHNMIKLYDDVWQKA